MDICEAISGKTFTLGELEKIGWVTLGRGKVISKIDIQRNPGAYPVYSSSAIGNGEIGRYGLYMFDDERITWSVDGGGRLFYRPAHKYSVTNVCGWLKVNDPRIDARYLHLLLTSRWRRVKFDYTYKAHPSVIRDAYRDLCFPDIEIQRRFAGMIDQLEGVVRRREKQLEKFDQLVKSRFVEMFGDPLQNAKKWAMRSFGDICSVRQGLQIPIAKRLVVPRSNCYEYITVAYLHGAKSREYIENPKSNVICRKDDILMTRTGNTGMVVTDVEGVFHNNFFLIDFDRKRFDRRFLVHYLNLPEIQVDIRRRAGTSTIPDLNHGEFYKICLFEPPLALQREFAAFVAEVDKSKFAVRKRLEKARLLYRAKLQEYFG